MLTACGDYVAGEFLRLMVDRFASVLGPPDPWELRTRQIDKNSLVVDFVYPACLKTVELIGHIKPVVVLEPGTHAEFIPRGTYTIRPFVAEQFPQLFNTPDCQVDAITAERTFWEKATILACRVPSAGGQAVAGASFASLL